MLKSQDVFDRLAQGWGSTLVARHEVARFSGGVLHPRTMANVDSLGLGPDGMIRIGKKVAYDKALLVEWMRGRSKSSMSEIQGA